MLHINNHPQLLKSSENAVVHDPGCTTAKMCQAHIPMTTGPYLLKPQSGTLTIKHLPHEVQLPSVLHDDRKNVFMVKIFPQDYKAAQVVARTALLSNYA